MFCKKNSNKSEEEELDLVGILSYVKEVAQLTYDSEEKREQSLIQQASQMQAAFSFMTAVIFLIVSIFVEHYDKLSYDFYFKATTSVIVPLFISLIFATFVQIRFLTKTFEDIPVIYDHIVDNLEMVQSKEQRLKQWIIYMGKVQTEKARLNKRRVIFIYISMVSFYISIGLIIMWFIIGIST